MKSRRDRGMTLLEIVVAIGILAIGLVGLVSVIVHTTRHNATMRENLIAMRAAEKQIEEMQNTSFDLVFSTFNAPAKKTFDVTGLKSPIPSTKVGSIKFPTDAGGTQLLETATGAVMGGGSNLDLNGNGSIDAGNIANLAGTPATYGVLPVEIELQWRGVQGKRLMSYRHIILRK